jgi:hypothetical protein
MDALTFIVEMTKALAWPASVIFIIVLLRKPIIELLPFLEELKYKDFALKFHKEVSKAKEKISFESSQIKELPQFKEEQASLLKIAEVSPRAAVMESWASLQNTLLKISLDAGEIDNIENYREHSRTGHVMLSLNAFTKSDFQIYHNLRDLRNKATHMPDFIISTQDAKDFVSLATQLAFIARARTNANT